MQTILTNAKIEWLPRKVKRRLRTPLNQGNPRVLVINVPKRLHCRFLFVLNRSPDNAMLCLASRVLEHTLWNVLRARTYFVR